MQPASSEQPGRPRQSPFVRRPRGTAAMLQAPARGTESPRPNPAGSGALLAAIATASLLVASGIDNPARVSALLVGGGLAVSTFLD